MTPEEYARVENGKVVGKAIDFMRSLPRGPDGEMGYMAAKGSPEWHAWEAYFAANGMGRKASLMRTLSAFMVPCAKPEFFDPAYVPPRLVADAKLGRMASEMSKEDVDRVIAKARNASRMYTPAPKYEPEQQNPDEIALQRFALTDEERRSAVRLTGSKNPDEQPPVDEIEF